jgi:signal transduction histidine kinase
VLVLVPYVALAYLLARAGLPELLQRLAEDLARLAALPGPAGPQAELPVVASLLYTGTLGALVLGLSLGGLGVALWLLVGIRAGAQQAAPPATSAPALLVGAMDEGLAALDLGGEPRTAIIRCYRCFEGALARARVPRAPWQTPIEFMREATSRLPLPAAAARGLTELFERARFSREPLGPAERDAAGQALRELRASLDGEGSGARPG